MNRETGASLNYKGLSNVDVYFMKHYQWEYSLDVKEKALNRIKCYGEDKVYSQTSGKETRGTYIASVRRPALKDRATK